MNSLVGKWIEVDASDAAASVRKGGAKDGMLVSPSQFDIPLALRVIEEDIDDPAFCVELRYLGGNEKTESLSEQGGVEFEIGEKSGRLYRLFVSSELANAGARTTPGVIIDQIKKFRTKREARGVKTTNYDLVVYAVNSYKDDIYSFLDMAAKQAKTKSSLDNVSVARRSRLFDESWPDWKR